MANSAPIFSDDEVSLQPSNIQPARVAPAPQAAASGAPVFTDAEVSAPSMPTQPQGAFSGDAQSQYADFVSALAHHGMNALHGTAQLIEHGLAKGADLIDPNYSSNNLSSTITGKPTRSSWNQSFQNTVASDDQALADMERQYQAQTPNTAGAYAGATVGEILPWMVGIGEANAGRSAASKLGELGDAASWAASKLGIRNKVASKLISGTTQGAAVGAAAPVTDGGDYWTEKGLQTGIGAGLGTVGGGVGAAFGRNNPTEKAADLLKQAIGPDQVPSIVRTLASQPGELVAGSQPTVPALTQNQGIVNTFNAVRAASPEAGAAIEQQLADNNAARWQALQRLAGTDEAYQKAVADRAAASDGLYSRAYSAGPDLDVAQSPEMQQTWAGLLKRPAVQTAFKDARSNLANAGESLPATNSATESQVVQLGDYSVRSLDDRIAAAQAQGSTEEVRGLQATRSALADALGQLSPGYVAANQAYRAASGPITDMEAARTILGKFANSGNITLAPTGSIQGLPRITLGQYNSALKAVTGGDYQPSSQATTQLQAIQKDLQRETGQFQAKGTGSNTVDKQALAAALQGGVADKAVQQLASMAGAGVGHAFGPAGSAIGAEVGNWLGSLPAKSKQAVLGKIGDALTDPDKMRALLTYTQAPTNRQMLANALMRGGQFNAARSGGNTSAQQP